MKNKKDRSKPVIEQGTRSDISKIGVKVILSGVLLLAAGFFVLTKTDPAGQNLASKLSPFLILGGYTAIGIGIIVPESPDSKSTMS